MEEQRTRGSSRKTHSKSRGGCFSCKQRHIKCDEARPRCANCVRLDKHCSWPAIPRRYPKSLSPALDNHDSVLPGGCSISSLNTIESGIGAGFSIADLRLLHHWISKGYSSMRPNHSAEDNKYWRDHLTETAFEHPFLLHGYLALSAVHRSCSDSAVDRSFLLLQADSHISQGLAMYRTHIESPVLEEAIPMFMMCTVLFTYNLGSAQLQQPDDSIAAIHHCFRLLAGTEVVFDPFWQQLKGTEVFAHITDLAEEDYIEALDARAEGKKTPEILALKELITEYVPNVQDKESCMVAVNSLHMVSLRVRHASARSNEYSLVLGWAAHMDEGFMGLVSSYNPVACIIVSYFAALLAQGRPVWWIGHWPRWLLAASEELLSPTPELLKWLDWPRRTIGYNASNVASIQTVAW